MSRTAACGGCSGGNVLRPSGRQSSANAPSAVLPAISLRPVGLRLARARRKSYKHGADQQQHGRPFTVRCSHLKQGGGCDCVRQTACCTQLTPVSCYACASIGSRDVPIDRLKDINIPRKGGQRTQSRACWQAKELERSHRWWHSARLGKQCY